MVFEKQCSQVVRNSFSFLIVFHGNIKVISVFILKLPVNICNLPLCSITVEDRERKYEYNSKCGTLEGMIKQNAIYDIQISKLKRRNTKRAEGNNC